MRRGFSRLGGLLGVLVLGLTGTVVPVGPLAPSVAHAAPSGAPVTIKDQAVVINSQLALDIPFAFGDVSVGSSDIIKVIPLRDTKQILVAGRQEGTTNIILYDTRGARRAEFEVTVIPANLAKVMKNVQALLEDIEGLEFKVINDRVYIQGEVSLDNELARVKDLDERESLVESMVTLSPVAQKLLASLIEKEIGAPGVNVRLVGKKIMLEGIVHSAVASQRAEAIAKAYYPDAAGSSVINVLEVKATERTPGRNQTVVLVVHFVELTKSVIDSWGLEWTPLASTGIEMGYEKLFTGGQAAAPTSYLTSTVAALLPKLEYAKQSGYARVLENPTVSVKSGDPAHIFSGARVPFVFIENGTQTIVFEEVGITMDVTPYAQGTDVDIALDVGVSSLGEVAANGYPTIDKSQIRTTQFCRAGESIVVGGLQRLSDRTDYNRVPQAGGGGGIVTLYKSKHYKKTKSQFLVFITPQIHETSTTANREIQEKFNLSEVRQ
jgi:pilus assembly protein CpaC